MSGPKEWNFIFVVSARGAAALESFFFNYFYIFLFLF